MTRINALIEEALTEFPDYPEGDSKELVENHVFRKATKSDLFPLIQSAIWSAYRSDTLREERAAERGPSSEHDLSEAVVVDPLAARTAFLARSIWIPTLNKHVRWSDVTPEDLLDRAAWQRSRAHGLLRSAEFCEQWAAFLKDSGVKTPGELGQQRVYEALVNGLVPDPKEVVSK